MTPAIFWRCRLASFRPGPFLAALLFLFAAPFAARAALQFDVFLGYDNTVHEGGWFPVACEVFNDGPSFNAVFELSNENIGRSQARRVALELPTNTRKRFSIPVFASAGRYSRWSARLIDERGKVRAEQLNLQPRDKSADTFLLGALPRVFAGLPVLPDIKQKQQEELQPRAVRLGVELFPDNPVSLEGLDALYLNSEKALDLKQPQVEALLGWLHGGGRLILGVEQPGDVNGTPWLRALLPGELSGVTTLKPAPELDAWLRAPRGSSATNPAGTPLLSAPADPRANRRVVPRPGTPGGPAVDPAVEVLNLFANLPADAAFADGAVPVATGVWRDGRVLLAAHGTPLVVEARRGRGTLTVLTFSPEREPFRSWKNAPWFWVRLANVPAARFATPDQNRWGGMSIDAVFGAMIDSRQVRKLPVGWLLAILVVYLAVIGPFDQIVLKRLGRQMLTWLTFPAYVALFSLLIYYIGYKLRAGETEWNELHIVDVLPRADHADLRGRTYASVYSPVNASYRIESTQPHATLRGEFQGAWGGGQENSRANVEQRAQGYRAEISVPVWTSQLYVSDWLEPVATPLAAKVVEQAGKFVITVENHLAQGINAAQVVVRGQVFELGAIAAGQTQTVTLALDGPGKPLRTLADQSRGLFHTTGQNRRHALGNDQGSRIEKTAASVLITSFLAPREAPRPNNEAFLEPQGLDLTGLVERGDAVVFAWVENFSPAAPIHRFTPRRYQRDTMLRLAVPVTTP